MVDFKSTLINLHKKFPDYDLDTLIVIIDSIVETIDYSKFDYPYGIKYHWDLPKVTCDNISNYEPKIRNLNKEYTAEEFK